MPTIAALIVGPEEQTFVRNQLAGVATPHFCESVESLERLVSASTSTVQAVLADLRDAAGTDVMPALGRLRARVPALPLVLCFRPTPATLRDLPAVMALLPGLGVVLRGFEHLGLAIRKLLLGTPRPPSAADILMQRLVPLAPPPLQAFFTICALKGSPRLRVSAAAAWSHVPRRTLERRLVRAGLPSAAVVLGSCAALHAAWWLDVQGWSSKEVIREMQFGDRSALTRLFSRRFGCTVSQLRDCGGFDVLLKRFERMLRRGWN